jgi:hypothetical protein
MNDGDESTFVSVGMCNGCMNFEKSDPKDPAVQALIDAAIRKAR